MTVSSPFVLAEVRNRVGHLTLNRPEGLNALTLQMIQALHQQLLQWADDSKVRAIVLRSSSTKAFCAGGDIRSLHESFTNKSDLHQRFFVEEYALDRYIHHYPKPILSLMDGITLGGGMGLVQGTPLRVVTERSRLGMPEVSIGFFPDVGASYFLSRLPGRLGAYLGLTGMQIRASDALYSGLANWCLDSELIPELDVRLDSFPWTFEPLRDMQALLAELGAKRLPGAELKAMQPAIDQHFELASVSAIEASLRTEQRPQFAHWAEETLERMSKNSPVAMGVTLEQLQRGRELSLDDCFKLELHLGSQWFERGDLIEGVRALLIDKDKSPKWNPVRVDLLTPEHIQTFFPA